MTHFIFLLLVLGKAAASTACICGLKIILFDVFFLF
ncbi:hypothetical protein N750_12465 [Legionella pneumophila str. Leg01/53]|nr:hypothetical protein N750_12465 [Legionella pneumophila str. Leg01/53]